MVDDSSLNLSSKNKILLYAHNSNGNMNEKKNAMESIYCFTIKLYVANVILVVAEIIGSSEL